MSNLSIECVDSDEILTRSVTLTNQQWAVLCLCIEAYTSTWRSRCADQITIAVSNGLLDKAVKEAKQMDLLLTELDTIQAKIA